MAGELIRVEINDSEVRRMLTKMRARVGDLRPFMKVAGEALVEETKDRFRTMTDPEGHPWKPLSAAYAATKKRSRGKILYLRGRLEGSIRYQLDGSDTVLVGTNVVYAAIHQFGGDTKPHTIRPKNKRALFWPGAAHPVRSVNHPGSHIPARPYLGMGDRDRARILALAEEFLAQAVG
jgi:phage virion morphogenesis protein